MDHETEMPNNKRMNSECSIRRVLIFGVNFTPGEHRHYPSTKTIGLIMKLGHIYSCKLCVLLALICIAGCSVANDPLSQVRLHCEKSLNLHSERIAIVSSLTDADAIRANLSQIESWCKRCSENDKAGFKISRSIPPELKQEAAAIFEAYSEKWEVDNKNTIELTQSLQSMLVTDGNRSETDSRLNFLLSTSFCDMQNPFK